jgi:hypothetical protein
MRSLADGRLQLEGIESPFRIRPLLRALYGFRGVLVALFATFPGFACENAGILHSSHHLELGVQFSTHEPRIMEQSSRALKRWSEIADMAWHREDSNNCSISIADGKFTDKDELAEANAEAGSIIFAGAGELTVNELFLAAFHETSRRPKLLRMNRKSRMQPQNCLRRWRPSRSAQRVRLALRCLLQASPIDL